MNTPLPLPTALQAWHPWLRWFAPELAAALGEILRRMYPWLGRFQVRRQGGVAEPDGVEDLRRNGSYERLLSSEWLLATELPDEFLRRAAGGEHLFLAPRPRARQADRLIVAIFDVGPMQLGAPRLAQLALWILLARRALEAGGELRWGVLHQPGIWHDAATVEQLKRMLQARTFAVAEPLHGAQWMHWLAENATGVGETWFIGHQQQLPKASTPAPSHQVRLRSALDGQSLQVDLRARSAARTLLLDLPAPQPNAQLLRGRFMNETPAAHAQYSERLSLKFAPLIAPNGLSVAVPLLDGSGVLVFRWPPPGQRKGNTQRHWQWAKHSEPLCAGFSGKSFAAILSHAASQSLHFWQTQQALTIQARPPPAAFDAPPGRGSLLPGIWQRDHAQTRVFVIDGTNRLVFWEMKHQHQMANNEPHDPTQLDSAVVTMAKSNDSQLVYLAHHEGHVWVRFVRNGQREQNQHRLQASDTLPSQAFLAGGWGWTYSPSSGGAIIYGSGACAMCTSSVAAEEWVVYEKGQTGPKLFDSWKIVLTAGARVVGLVHHHHAAGSCYALVVQASNHLDFVLHSKHGPEAMFTLPQAAQRVSVCPTSGVVAVLTVDRSLHVYSTADKSMRLVVQGKTTPPENHDDA